MKSTQTVLYCRNLRPSQIGVLGLSSPIYSMSLQLKSAGLDMLVVGVCEENRAVAETVRGMGVHFVDHRSSGPSIVAQIRSSFPDCSSFPLVIARDLPSARCSLRVAKALKSPAYYESLETWTGYHVVNGKRVFPDFYRTYLRERLVVRRFRQVIVHSLPAKEYQARLYGLDDDHIGVTYSALPVPDGEGSFPLLDAVRPGERLIVCSGLLAAGRGLEDLVTCFAYMPNGYKLLLAGDGKLKETLEQIVADKGIQDKVIFHGNVPVTEYYRLLKRADIGIDFRSDSTLNYDLAMSCRVIDYINCGVPVICSSTQGFQDLERRLGIVKCMPSGLSPEQQAERMVQFSNELIDDQEQMARKLKHAMDQEFSLEANARKFRTWLSRDGVI